MPEDTVMMEGVRIIFRNFVGQEGPYNKAGDRNFGVLLSAEVAEAMLADGWNVKWLKPREDAEEEETDQPWLPVSLKYHGINGPVRPPLVVIVTNNKRIEYKEEDVEVLDWADIRNVDLIVRPYPWNFNGKTGVKAYLKSMFITVEEDALEQKYADLERQ